MHTIYSAEEIERERLERERAREAFERIPPERLLHPYIQPDDASEEAWERCQQERLDHQRSLEQMWANEPEVEEEWIWHT
jgi:hypothetical protein